MKVERVGARRLPGARHAARIEAARRLPVGASSGACELASVPVAPELVDFLHEVARRRADPSELPGLEAMMPRQPGRRLAERRRARRSPASCASSPATCEGDSIGSWLKTLLVRRLLLDRQRPRRADALDVRRRAARRERDRRRRELPARPGGKVSHFNYFAQRPHGRRRSSSALTRRRSRPSSRAIGPLSWAGEDASGTRAANAVARSRGGRRHDGAAIARRCSCCPASSAAT